MKLFRRILLAIVIIFVLLVSGLGLYAWLRQDRLTEAVIRKINSSLNTKISYSTLDVTIFGDFPNITIRLNDLLVSPSQFYDKKQFAGYDNDTLLFASSFSVSVHLPSLLTGTIAVRSITAHDGEVNLLTDKRGDINFKVLARESSEGDKSLKLNNISASRIKTVWYDRKADIKIIGTINESNLSGEIFSSGIFLSAILTADLNSVDVYGIHSDGGPGRVSVRLRKSENSLSITKGSVDLAGLNFDIDGTINFSMKQLDLAINGRKTDLADLSSLLPDRFRPFARGLGPSGLIDLSCTIKGQYGETGTPHIEVHYDLSDGRLGSTAIPLRVNDLAFRGTISNGKNNSPESFHIKIDTLTSSFGSAFVRGSFTLSNLRNPYVRASLGGDLNFDDLRKIIKSDIIRHQKGSITGSLKIEGHLPDSLKLSSASLPLLNPEASLVFKNFGATVTANDLVISDVNGTVNINHDLISDSLSFRLYDQLFIVDARFANFTEWLAGRSGVMEVTGNVSADTFIPSRFTGAKEKDAGEDEGPGPGLFPNDIIMNIAFTADSIISKDFRARNFSSAIAYRPHVFTFSNIRAEGLEGLLAGNLILGRQNDGSFLTRARLEVTDIEIGSAFSSFNNFGQKFIVSKNLQGRLTGNVTILSPLDTNFRISARALIAEAHLSVVNGHLKDFKPVESLSSFIDLDEMKDIAFSKLENDLYIRNSSLTIPKMLINSSAGNFTMYGTHSFSGDYSYHIRVLLSEVMSRKARENNRNDASFGKVKVDDSGKATIPLKIVCENGKTGVSYDFGQAQDNIKENIAGEKQTLKGILNEEYGWYKGDTIIKPAEENKPRFAITWEEGKDQASDTVPSQEQETQNPLKGLIRKKRK